MTHQEAGGEDGKSGVGGQAKKKIEGGDQKNGEDRNTAFASSADLCLKEPLNQA